MPPTRRAVAGRRVDAVVARDGVDRAGRAGLPRVPDVTAIPQQRQVARRGMHAVTGDDRLLRRRRRAVGGGPRADQAVDEARARLDGRGGADAEEALAVLDEALQRGLTGRVEHVAGDVDEHERLVAVELGVVDVGDAGGLVDRRSRSPAPSALMAFDARVLVASSAPLSTSTLTPDCACAVPRAEEPQREREQQRPQPASLRHCLTSPPSEHHDFPLNVTVCVSAAAPVMRSVNFALTAVFERARALRTAAEGWSDTVARPSSPHRSTFLARVPVLSLSLRTTERSTVSVTVPRETPWQLTLNLNRPARSALSVETFEADRLERRERLRCRSGRRLRHRRGDHHGRPDREAHPLEVLDVAGEIGRAEVDLVALVGREVERVHVVRPLAVVDPVLGRHRAGGVLAVGAGEGHAHGARVVRRRGRAVDARGRRRRGHVDPHAQRLRPPRCCPRRRWSGTAPPACPSRRRRRPRRTSATARRRRPG